MTTNISVRADPHDVALMRHVFEAWYSHADPDSATYNNATALKRILDLVSSEKGDMVLVPRSFLEATPCPNCDGSGFIVSTGPDPQQEQCQWCYEKHMILSGAERA